MEKQETMADFAAELEESYKTLEEYEQYDIPEEDMTAWETLKEMMGTGYGGIGKGYGECTRRRSGFCGGSTRLYPGVQTGSSLCRGYQ